MRSRTDLSPPRKRKSAFCSSAVVVLISNPDHRCSSAATEKSLLVQWILDDSLCARRRPSPMGRDALSKRAGGTFVAKAGSDL